MTTPAPRRDIQTRIELEGLDLDPAWITETVRVITAHESVRGYTDRDIPSDALEAILVSARSAPTSSNLQAYSIVVVRDPATRAAIHPLVGNQRCLLEAPVFLVFCADISRLTYNAQRQGRPFAARTLEMFLTASLDAGLALQNALVAAESMGLAAVPVGSVRNDPDAIAELLALPQGVYAVAGLCLGWEREGVRRGTKPRLPADAIVHRERYDASRLEEHLRAYDATMIARRTYDGRRVSLAGEPEKPGVEYGWTEHTARRTSKPETLLGPSATLRERLKEIVEGRGFTIR